MSQFFSWLITSSSDPEKTSLAVQGFLLSLAPILMLFFHISTADIQVLVQSIGNVIFLLLSIVSSVMLVIGLLRKYRLGRWSAQ